MGMFDFLGNINPFSSGVGQGEPLSQAGGNIWGALSGQNAQNAFNTQAQAQQEQYTKDNMATSFGYDQQAYQRSLTDQTNLANTAHQREQADLKAAGLNPILSGTGGGGSMTPNVQMGAPAAIGGPSANQGMKAGGLADLAQLAMNAISTGKDADVATQKAREAEENINATSLDSKLKSNLLPAKTEAAKAELSAATAAAQQQEAYTRKDMENPNVNYYLNKVNGGGANSAKSLMDAAATIMEMF
jgi:hypothetical protein